MPGKAEKKAVVMTRLSQIAFVVLLTTMFCAQAHSREAGMENQYDVSEVVFQKDRKHPILACTPEELNRLKEAYDSNGEEGAFLADLKERVDEWMEDPVVFPPRGKAHNQWYQCDDCQIGLETLAIGITSARSARRFIQAIRTTM